MVISLKKIMLIIKKIVMALFMLYSFNLIIGYAGILIPINLCSIVLVSIFGVPAVFSLIVLTRFL